MSYAHLGMAFVCLVDDVTASASTGWGTLAQPPVERNQYVTGPQVASATGPRRRRPPERPRSETISSHALTGYDGNFLTFGNIFDSSHLEARAPRRRATSRRSSPALVNWSETSCLNTH